MNAIMHWLAERFAPGSPFAVLCVLFLLGTVLIWWRPRRVSARPTVRFGSILGLRLLSHGIAARVTWLPKVLRTLAVLALAFALARPQSGGEVRDLREGIAIQMVMDVSGSMSETDFVLGGRRVRRLDAVKEVFRDFVLGTGGLHGRTNDLIGMTTFAMYPDTRCPLTTDHANLVNLLDTTEIPGWVEGRQRFRHAEANYTSLGDAITLATDELRRAGEQAVAGIPGAEAAKSRVMILLTDGANNPPPDAVGRAPKPQDAAKLAAELGIRIYTIGAVGSAARDTSRGLFASPRADVDEPTLKAVADITGAKYFRATDSESLRAVYADIDELERRSTGERTYRDNAAAARTAMLVGLGLLMGEVLLVNTVLRRIP
jgi:Ca-activated chloride channel family protein